MKGGHYSQNTHIKMSGHYNGGKMKKIKLLNSVLVLSLLFTISNTPINAKETQKKNAKEDTGIDYVKMEEVTFDKDDQNQVNHLERKYTGKQYAIPNGLPASNNKQKNADNTDPNNA